MTGRFSESRERQVIPVDPLVRLPAPAVQAAFDRALLEVPDNTLSVSWVRARMRESVRWGCFNVAETWAKQLRWLKEHPEVATA